MATKESFLLKIPTVLNEIRSSGSHVMVDVESLSVNTTAISSHDKTNVRPLRSPLYPPVKRLAYPTGTAGVNNKPILSPRKLASKNNSPSSPPRVARIISSSRNNENENFSHQNLSPNIQNDTGIYSIEKPKNSFHKSSSHRSISPSEKNAIINISNLKSFQTPSNKNEKNLSPKAIMNLSKRNSPESSISSSPIFGNSMSEKSFIDDNFLNEKVKEIDKRDKDKKRKKDKVRNKEEENKEEKGKGGGRDVITTPQFSGYITCSPTPQLKSTYPSPISPYLPYETKKKAKNLPLNSEKQISPLVTKESELETICPTLNFDIKKLNFSSNSVDLKKMLEIVGNNILSVGNVVTNKATDATIIVTSVVGLQAEKVINNTSLIVPRFSTQDMSQIIIRKNNLLDELSKSCIQLGLLEDKEKEMENTILELNKKEIELYDQNKIEKIKINYLENYIKDLKENLSNNIKEKDLLFYQFNKTKSELENEVHVTKELNSKYDELQLLCNTQDIQLKKLTDDYNIKEDMYVQRTDELNIIKNERERDLSVVQGELEQMFNEQEGLRREIRLASEQALAQLAGKS